ncbi:hypothetical protein [Salinicola tamaricis]|uniref:hypothetical protein n=1 Tax=Salinicola tamaricis TaxID=1771309 RepID=UPI00101AE05C|nr:hypothetical protein [Salinicola tamaricis]
MVVFVTRCEFARGAFFIVQRRAVVSQSFSVKHSQPIALSQSLSDNHIRELAHVFCASRRFSPCSASRPDVARAPRLAATLLLASLATGCAGGVQPTSGGSGAGGGTGVDSPKAADAPQSPLLPSAFFADGGERFSAWRCTPSQNLVTTTPDAKRLRLWTALGSTELQRAVATDGERYVLGGVAFERHGRDARVESDHGQLVCALASERATTTRRAHPQSIFYASGNEPGWNVSLDRQTTTLTLVSDYGQATDTFRYPRGLGEERQRCPHGAGQRQRASAAGNGSARRRLLRRHERAAMAGQGDPALRAPRVAGLRAGCRGQALTFEQFNRMVCANIRGFYFKNHNE